MEVKETFRFCPRCGANFDNKETFLKCPACGLSYYLNPKPTTVVVLVNGMGEYLLVERAVDPGKGLWDLPGGFVEEGETFEQSAKREISEELGVEIENLSYVTSAFEPYLFQEVIYPTLAACFVAKFPPHSKPKPADDTADFKFFDPADLPSDKFAFRAMHTVLEATTEFLRANPL